jgi:hypothetical protein
MGVANRPRPFFAALLRPECILPQFAALALELMLMAALETVALQLRQVGGMSEQDTLAEEAQDAMVARLLRATEATSYDRPEAVVWLLHRTAALTCRRPPATVTAIPRHHSSLVAAHRTHQQVCLAMNHPSTFSLTGVWKIPGAVPEWGRQ